MSVDIFRINTVELLVLLFLRESDAHGYQLVQMLEEYSSGTLTVKTASLYPILYRLADNGMVTSREVIVERTTKAHPGRSSRVRVVYHLEPSGYARIEELLADHHAFVAGCETVIQKLERGGCNEKNSC